jgi:hypothetical protein
VRRADGGHSVLLDEARMAAMMLIVAGIVLAWITF